MNVYANKKTYDLRYIDFDFKDELKLSALLGLLQESAGLSATELGFGYHALKAKGYGFIVVHTYCEFRRPIRLGDEVTVETWPLPPRHVIFERDYRVTGRGGEELAAVASRWCLVDLGSFSLLTPDKLGEANDRCPYRAEQAVVPPNWKIPHADGDEVRRFRVGCSVADHYLHVNNTHYADFFLDCFSMEELAARPVRAFRIAYAKQVKEGSEISFYRRDMGDSTVLEARTDGEPTTQFQLYFA